MQKCGIVRKITALTAAVAVLPVTTALSVEHDLSAPGSQSVNVVGDVGGTAIFADHWEQPTGTGVFDPFLTLDSNGQTSTGSKNIESAYNLPGFLGSGGPPNPLFPALDQLRPNWNTYLRVSDLATVTVDNVDYFAFVLDSNEPGGNKKLISIDNIRVYTSSTDTHADVGGDISKLDDLGELRWAMNDPLSTGTEPPDLNGFNVDTWVKLDSTQENVGHGNANGGSGQGDMIVYIPQTAFGDSVGTDDYVWFYNLNGVHHTAEFSTGAQAGYEEWRAVVGPQQVPDGGATLALLGASLGAFGVARRFMRR